MIRKYEITIIPNYGNDKIIIKTVQKFGIKTTGETRPSGFSGIDVPVLLDIECTEDQKNKLEYELQKINTDTFVIMEVK
jgi:hypothetical protein